MEAKKRIPESEWTWFGSPAHFIAANECRFHMATSIGDVIVSTVGEYFPKCRDGKNPEEIGYRRTYETMVFRISKTGKCQCGCGMPEITSHGELAMAPANSRVAAHKAHYKLCNRAAKGEFLEDVNHGQV